MTAVDLSATQAGPVRTTASGTRLPASAWLRDLGHLPDALLHPRRRRAAEIRLHALTPRSILFICHGNICRSPFAAAIFARSYPQNGSRRVTAASAGFIGPGRMPPMKALFTGLRYGVDISSHRSDVLTTERLQAADLVVVMSESQERAVRARLRNGSKVLVLGDLDPVAITRRTIADPWGGSDSAYDASYNRIDRCVRELVRIIRHID